MDHLPRRNLDGTESKDSILSNDDKLQEYLTAQNLTDDDTSKKNLIVNYLPVSFRECHLAHLFCEVGELVSVRIIVDKKTKRSKGYGFVKFTTSDEAAKAIQLLNGKMLLGKRLKVAYARPGGPRARANLFVGNVPKYWNDKDLEDLFVKFGPIIESRILRNPDMLSRRCGFVRLDTEEAANRAIAEMDGYVPSGQYHGIHVKIAERPDGRREAQNDFMPSAFPELGNKYDSYLNKPRRLQGTQSESIEMRDYKRDPTKSRKRNIMKTRSLPIFDDQMVENFHVDSFDDRKDEFEERKKGEREQREQREQHKREVAQSQSHESDNYNQGYPPSNYSSGGAYVQEQEYNTQQNYNTNMYYQAQQPPLVMTNVLPPMQYTLHPISGFESSISPATTPPPYMMATTPPFNMNSIVTSPDQQMFSPDQRTFTEFVPQKQAEKEQEEDKAPEKAKKQVELRGKPKKGPLRSLKRKFQKFKKTESEMELESLGIDMGDLPTTMPTIKEQTSFHISITKDHKSEENVASPPATQNGASLELQTSENLDSATPPASNTDLPATVLLEQIVQKDTAMQNNLSDSMQSNQNFANIVPVTPPFAGVAGPPIPIRLSPSPLTVNVAIPITPPLVGTSPVNSLPPLPLTSSPVVQVPVLSTSPAPPTVTTSPGYLMQDTAFVYSSPQNNLASPDTMQSNVQPDYNQQQHQMQQNYNMNQHQMQQDYTMNQHQDYGHHYGNQRQHYGPQSYQKQQWQNKGHGNNQYDQDSYVLPPAQQVSHSVQHGTHVCLFVYNLPPFFDEAHLYHLFGEYGPVKYTTVHRHKDGTSKGFGFVNYYTSESARRAIKSLNGNILYKKKLQVRHKV